MGPDASLLARDAALGRLAGARGVVVVEGVSDQVAIEAAALALGRDLRAEGVVVLPAGGVGSILALALQVGPRGAGLPLRGLCDAAEVPWLCRTVTKAGIGIALDRPGLTALGFQVCDPDLEAELIRALGPDAVRDLFRAEGDTAAFATMQRQKVWREAPVPDQMRRFLGAGAGRKTRYARLMVGALAPAALPAPLLAVLAPWPGLRADPLLV